MSRGSSSSGHRAFAEGAGDASHCGVLEYTEKRLVSADIFDNAASCLFSAAATRHGPQVVKVPGWYDNERAYACQLTDLVELLISR